MTNAFPKSVVFITGTFLGNACWDDWILYFERNGYECVAPAWPNKYASPEELRNRHMDADIALDTLSVLTEYFAAIVKALPEAPILVGHSLGGLIAQLLLQRGLGSAAVAIHSFPPLGVSTFRFSFLKAWWEAMSIFSSSEKSYMIPFSKWKSSIANGFTCEQQTESFYEYAVPESKRIIRNAFGCTTKVDFRGPHAPLLFISGGRDRMIPASLNYNNFKKYKQIHSITRYKNFKHRNHLVFAPSPWIEEAGFIIRWLRSLQ
jgi:pimeloyl-ACP methyl ester carboxylesterase